MIAPSNLWLTIHESVGHPTELDRMLGYEANFAGTSFAKVADLGKLKYGSPLVNVVADRTQPHALGTVGWDDDGQPGDKWDLIKKGTLVGVQTTREQAAWVHDKHGHAGDYAESWSAVPFQRMPNVSLQPGKKQRTPEEIIADTKRGIYIEGDGSWSIDHQRYNFQFGGQQLHAHRERQADQAAALRRLSIEQRRLLALARRARRRARLLRRRLARSTARASPSRSNPVSHGCVTSRFRRHPRHQHEERVMERPLDEETARAAVKAAFEAVNADDVRVNIEASERGLRALRGQRGDDVGPGDRRGDVGDLRGGDEARDGDASTACGRRDVAARGASARSSWRAWRPTIRSSCRRRGRRR